MLKVKQDTAAPEPSAPDVAAIHARFLPVIEWIAAAGLSGERELALLEGFCARGVAAGLPLGRAVIGIDTLHPVLEGRMFEWRRDGDAPVQSEYGRLDAERSEDQWVQSPFHRLYESGTTSLRCRLDQEKAEFPMLEDLRRDGMTDTWRSSTGSAPPARSA